MHELLLTNVFMFKHYDIKNGEGWHAWPFLGTCPITWDQSQLIETQSHPCHWVRSCSNMRIDIDPSYHFPIKRHFARSCVYLRDRFWRILLSQCILPRAASKSQSQDRWPRDWTYSSQVTFISCRVAPPMITPGCAVKSNYISHNKAQETNTVCIITRLRAWIYIYLGRNVRCNCNCLAADHVTSDRTRVTHHDRYPMN